MPLVLLCKVISGGQTGVDQVGLKVAKALGYETGGTAPRNWQTDEGAAPWLAGYGLVESPSYGYRNRTIDNARAADLTVWFGDPASPGGRLTKQAAGDRWLENPSGELLLYEINRRRVNVLNVAGNRLRTNPDASVHAEIALRYALRRG